MKVSSLWLSIAFMSFAIICISLFITPFYSNYGVPINLTEINALNKMADVEEPVDRIQAKLSGGGLTAIDGFVLAAQTVFEIIKILLTAPIIFIALVATIGTKIGIPSQITLGLITIVTFLVVIAVVRSLKGVGGGDI